MRDCHAAQWCSLCLRNAHHIHHKLHRTKTPCDRSRSFAVPRRPTFKGQEEESCESHAGESLHFSPSFLCRTADGRSDNNILFLRSFLSSLSLKDFQIHKTTDVRDDEGYRLQEIPLVRCKVIPNVQRFVKYPAFKVIPLLKLIVDKITSEEQNLRIIDCLV